MPVRKNTNKDLRSRYALYLEAGLILALGLLILAVRAEWQPSAGMDFSTSDQPLIPITYIPPTDPHQPRPEPIRPAMPVPVPDHEILEDDLSDLDLQPAQTLRPPVGPPPEPVKPVEPPPPFYIAPQVMPELLGGLAALQRKIRYPELAKKAGIEGRVTVQFIVDEEGYVRDAVVIRGIGGGCDEEALRAVQQARFKPGMQRSRAVPVKMSLPITFRLK